MPRIVAVELFELDLPLRQPFHHAAAERRSSESLFVRCFTDSGHCGLGETLPRPYVTGEERRDTFDLLADRILPRLLELEFTSFKQLHNFLIRCDGRAPAEWVEPEVPQTAAWCLVDLALLDSFARALGSELDRELAGMIGARSGGWPEGLRYRVVLSGSPGRRMFTTLLKTRLYGIRDVKVKVVHDSAAGVRLARLVLGGRARIHVDSNMAWSYDEAATWMARMVPYRVACFEQPLPADDLDGLARLVAETGFTVMADESLHDAASLEALISARACTAVNVRIAKCGGLVASIARCRRALEAGLMLQVGCQVAETSHLSAAQMVLIHALGDGVRWVEGCFGERLLEIDPIRPLLQFRRGGQPPRTPSGDGFGTGVDMDVVRRYAGRSFTLGEPVPSMAWKTP